MRFVVVVVFWGLVMEMLDAGSFTATGAVMKAGLLATVLGLFTVVARCRPLDTP